MPISDFFDLMPETIQHRAQTGTSQFGKPTYTGSATSYRARIVHKPRRVTSRITGEDVVASTRVWTEVIADIGIHSEITLPDGTKPLLLSWDLFPDADGDHHMALNLQYKQS